MIKQIMQFKVIVNDLENLFHFDATASTAIAKEACFACLKWIGQVEDIAKESAKAVEDVEKVIEEVPQVSQEASDDQPAA